MSNWVIGQDITVNLDNCVDFVHRKDNVVCAYTPSGFCLTLFKGTSQQCEKILEDLNVMVSARSLM